MMHESLANSGNEAPRRTVRERMLLMRSLPNLAGIDDEGLALLAEYARDRFFAPGDTVLVEGKPTESVHLVVDGRITVTRHGQRTAVVDRNGGVGFVTGLSGDPHGVTAIADIESVTLEIPLAALLDAYEESFSLMRNSLRVGARFIVRHRGSLPRNTGDETEAPLGTWRARNLTLVERILTMQGGIFEDVNLDAVVDLARGTEEVRYREGETIWSVGDPSLYWLRLDYGRVRCARDSGHSVVVGSGFVLGVMDALGDQTRSFGATAETAVTAFKLDLETFLTVLETHHELALKFSAVLSNTLLEAQRASLHPPPPE